jgi:ankyrin repeat protein
MSQEWFKAARAGALGDILSWIDQGTDVDMTDEFGRTALFDAVMTCQIEVIRALLEHGADPNAADRTGCTPTTRAVFRAQTWAVREPDSLPLEILVKAGGKLGLLEAVLMGDVDLARRVCDSDKTIDVSGDARFSFHDTFLMEAAKLGFLDMARFLLDRDADIEGINDLGATALMRAAARGHIQIVRLLLERGANVNHDDWSDQTPLTEAATNRHPEIVDLLLSRGAGRSLLDAVALDDSVLVGELLRGGSDANHLYYGHGRLVMYAVSRGNPEIVRLLLEHGGAHHHESVGFGSGRGLPGRAPPIEHPDRPVSMALRSSRHSETIPKTMVWAKARRSRRMAAVGLAVTSPSKRSRTTGRRVMAARRPPSSRSRTSIRASVAWGWAVG